MTPSTPAREGAETLADDAAGAVRNLHEIGRRLHLARAALNSGRPGDPSRVDDQLSAAVDALDRAVRDVQRLAFRVLGSAESPGPLPRHRDSPDDDAD